MALLTIGGTVMPTPTDFVPTIADISKATRNAKGDMLIERITTKRTLQVSWAYLTQGQTSSLLQAVSSTTFSVTYPDPVTGADRQSQFYCGDRSLGMIDYQGGVPRYKDVKFTLIEL